MIPLRLPLVSPGDDLVSLLLSSLAEAGEDLEDGDILVVTSKVVSKAKGYVTRLKDVRPGLRSRIASLLIGRDAREIELVRRNSARILFYARIDKFAGQPFLAERSVDPRAAAEMFRAARSLIAAEHPSLGILSDAGADWSNCPDDLICLLPPDPDAEAEEIRERIGRETGRSVGVVLTDTEWKFMGRGHVDVAVGVSGVPAVSSGFAAPDLYGRPKFGGMEAWGDELASAAALLMGQAGEGVAAVLIRGLRLEGPAVGAREAYLSREIRRRLLSVAARRFILLRILGL